MPFDIIQCKIYKYGELNPSGLKQRTTWDTIGSYEKLETSLRAAKLLIPMMSDIAKRLPGCLLKRKVIPRMILR